MSTFHSLPARPLPLVKQVLKLERRATLPLSAPGPRRIRPLPNFFTMKKTSAFLAAAMLPAVALAAGISSGIVNILSLISNVIGMLVPILIGLGLLYFLWGVIQYVIAGNEEAKKGAKQVMLYGLLGLFVMVGVWGIINLVGDTVFQGVSTSAAKSYPTGPTITTNQP